MEMTSGTWIAELSGNERPSGTGCDLFEIMAENGMVRIAENVRERDAGAIAAVPDMLAALRQCLPIVDAYRRHSGGDGDIAAMLVRLAITKATGQQA